MGWWDHGVMGGDEPLDIILDMEEIVGSRTNYEKDTGGLTKSNMTKNRKKLFDFGVKYRDERNHIALQVLAFQMMEKGVPMSEKMRMTMIYAYQHDEWAQEDKDRLEVMQDMIRVLQSYKGEPTDLHSPGLFETIAKKFG